MEKQISTNVLARAVKVNSKVNQAIWDTLRTSVHAGASEESILTIVAYQKEIDVNPLTKCYHVIKYKTKQKDESWKEIESIIPSITLYRIQASRSNLYSGISEPEFGPIIEKEFTTIRNGKTVITKVSYPAWCKLKGFRLVNGNSSVIAEFNSFVLWEENYAKANKQTGYPNDIWMNRPTGMLEKVCESQLLRKMFPEVCEGYTYEEMAGKLEETVDVTPEKPQMAVVEQNIVANKKEYEINLDGALLKPSDVPDLVKARINLSMHNGDLEEYEVWKKANNESLMTFAKKYPEEAATIRVHLNAAREKLAQKESKIINRPTLGELVGSETVQ